MSQAKQDGFGHEKPGEGQTNDWITPKWVFDALGEFDLDPCESNNQPWTSAKAGYRLCRGEDGLVLPWEGSVWCNPPYGNHVTHWIQKCAHHGNAIMLIYARVETRAWWEIWTSAHGILFPNKRIAFRLPNGEVARNGGTAPSAFVAFGKEAAERLKWAKIAGAYIYEGWHCYDGSEEDEEENCEAEQSGRSGVGVGIQPSLGFGQDDLSGGQAGVE